eukprot:g7759.t1
MDFLRGGPGKRDAAGQASSRVREEAPPTERTLADPEPLPKVAGPRYYSYKADSERLVSTAGFAAASATGAFHALVDARVSAPADIAGALEAYYRSAQQPVWVAQDDINDRAKAVLSLLDRAGEFGLDAADYKIAAPVLVTASVETAALAGADAPAVPASAPLANRDQALMQFELSLSEKVLLFAQDMVRGRIDPNRISGYHDMKRRDVRLSMVLPFIEKGPDAVGYLESLAPQGANFKTLKAELAKLRAEAADTANDIALPQTLLLKPGNSSADLPLVVAAIEKRGSQALKTQHAAAIAGYQKTPEYTPELVDLVKSFQSEVGLKPDGVIGAATLRKMAGHSPQDRIEKLIVAMEQARWLPDDLGQRYVFINQPAFRVYYHEHGAEQFSMRVVVGSKAHQTFFFQDEIETVEFNPYWGVPQSIIVNEMLPHLRRDPSYLDRMGYEVAVNGKAVPSSSVNWNGSTQNVSVRQPPSSDNALGDLKILFPNAHAIYMHDTPSKSFFQRDMRALSHGCVRLAEPRKMAAAVLGTTVQDVDGRIAAGKNVATKVPAKIPVYVAYFTAWPNKDGVVEYFDDVYDRDAAVDKAFVATSKARADVVDAVAYHDGAIAPAARAVDRAVDMLRIGLAHRKRVAAGSDAGKRLAASGNIAPVVMHEPLEELLGLSIFQADLAQLESAADHDPCALADEVGEILEGDRLQFGDSDRVIEAFNQDGMRLGIGTGSTAEEFVRLLAERVHDGLKVRGVPTSERTARLCLELGIPLMSLDELPELDLAIDGADEIDDRLTLVKGGGGALLREKIVAAACGRMIVIADESKLVPVLGKFPLPIEINPFGQKSTRIAIEKVASRLGLTGELSLRQAGDGIFTTDGGHYILDASFGRIPDAEGLAAELTRIPGVVEHGLFIGMASLAIIAGPAVSVPARAQEVSEAHLTAARQAIASLNVTDRFDNILPTLAEQLKAQFIQASPNFQNQISAIVDEQALALAPRRADLEKEAATIYAKAFSVDELKTISTFFNTEAGKKLLSTTPLVSRELGRAAEIWSNGISRDLASQSTQKLKGVIESNPMKMPAAESAPTAGATAPAQAPSQAPAPNLTFPKHKPKEIPMTAYDYDLFVIGGGSGGVRAGRVAASLGKRVGIAEEYRFGGTCVIRGCVPKKLLVYASQFHEHFEDAAGFGWTVGESRFDWNSLIAAKDREIARLEGLYRRGLETNGAEIFDSRAELVDDHTVRVVKTGATVTAERIIIATGGTANPHAALPGHELCITSNEAFHLERLPRSILIAGGGYIAVEFANIFHGLGVETTLIYRGKEILSRFDQDMRQGLHKAMVDKGIRIVLTDVIEEVSKGSDGLLTARTLCGEIIDVETVMLALGRDPNTAGLGLDAAGVAVNERGAVIVDDYSRTNVPNIYALGDVTDRVQLTPVAIHEAMCFIETVYKNNPTSPDYDLIPTAVFSQPEIGTVGLSEEQAAARYQEVEIYRAEFRPMKATLSGRTERMIMKLVVDAATRRVVGAHILGHDAGEMAQLLGVSLKAGVTKTDFDRTMAVHPTAAEELVTMYNPSYRIRNGERI